MNTYIEDPLLAWHFTGDNLRDGRPVPKPGEILTHEGPVELCTAGLHGSERALDAVVYAPGATVHRVEIWSDVERGRDKIAGRYRRILWSADATNTLRHFARLCALDVIDLWDAPDIVRGYLETGDETLRAGAWAVTARVTARPARELAETPDGASEALGAAWAARSAASVDHHAAWTARDTARDAAGAGAWADTWDTAWSAQNDRLQSMLQELAS